MSGGCGYGPAQAWNRHGEPVIKVDAGTLTYEEALRLSDKLRIWARFHQPEHEQIQEINSLEGMR
jgi:hypothetical protein